MSRVQHLGFGVHSVRFRVWGLGFGVWGLEFGVCALGLGFEVRRLWPLVKGFRVGGFTA